MVKKWFGWILEQLGKLIGLAKLVRRPMTFYTLVALFSFILMWLLVPEAGENSSVTTAALFGSLCIVVSVDCCCVYLWNKAKLDAGKMADDS